MTASQVETPRPGLAAAISAEWAKALTLRSAKVNLALGVALGIAFSLLLSLAIAVTYSDWATSQQVTFEPVTDTMAGNLFTTIFFAAVGVNIFSSEHSSGMIRLTLTVTPNRSRVLAAKGIVVAVLTLVATAVAALVMFLGGQLIFAANDLPNVGLGDPDAARMLGATIVTGCVYPLLGLAFAIIFRSTAPAIIAVLALVFLPMMFGGLFPLWWQENIMSLLPGSALNSLTTGHVVDSDMYLQPALATVVVVAWLVAMLGLANLVLNRRDA